jgi:hypothetical protein
MIPDWLYILMVLAGTLVLCLNAYQLGRRHAYREMLRKVDEIEEARGDDKQV